MRIVLTIVAIQLLSLPYLKMIGAILLVSIPLIIFGATSLTKVMKRFPIIVTIGAALLGFLAGEMLLTDPAVTRYFGEVSEQTVTFGGVLGAVLVVGLGTVMNKRKNKAVPLN